VDLVTASSPDPRYYKDGNGLRPTWRLWRDHPRWALTMRYRKMKFRLKRRLRVRP